MTRQEALEITRAIVERTDEVFSLLQKAYEGRIWIALEYDSWRQYIVAEFKISQSRAYQLLDYAKVQETFSTFVEKPNEAQARPLASLPPTQQREAWADAVKSSNGKPTAKQVVQSIVKMGIGKIHVGLHGQVRNSVALKQLKALWREASKADKEAFRKWIAA